MLTRSFSLVSFTGTKKISFFKKKSHIPHRVTEWTDKVNHRSSFATKNGKYQYFSVSVFNFSCTVETYIYIYIIRTGNSIGLDQILCHDI